MATIEEQIADFTAACDAAFYQLFITWEERNAAIEKFKQELIIPPIKKFNEKKVTHRDILSL